MAYNTNTPRAEYTASATQTVFPFLFKIFTTSDIKVYQTLAGATPDDTADILVLTTDYTVTINGDAGGEVILNTGAAVNDKITLARNLSVTRATEYQQNGDLLASTLNSDQEYQTYLIADNVSNDSRYIKVPDSVQNVSTSLPAPESDAYIKWNAAANAIENDTTIPDAVTTSAANAEAAAASATQAELYEWEAEAERLTADSYATEAEDVPVNLVTSDGDGTFTYTPITEYSALHWAAKAATFNPALYYTQTEIDEFAQIWQNQATTITPSADSDYTLTAAENKYGRLILVDGSWTTDHNIIIDNTERSLLVDASGLTLNATVKTSAGTGIAVLAGTKVWLLCDGTNVIESADNLFSGGLTTDNFLHVQDQKTSGTGAGAAVAGNQTRVINTVLTNTITGASLASNTITLPAGDYFATGESTGRNLDRFQASLYDNTLASFILNGSSELSLTADVQTKSFFSGTFTLSGTTDVIVNFYSTNANAFSGLGLGTASGQIEVYTDVKIWKVG